MVELEQLRCTDVLTAGGDCKMASSDGRGRDAEKSIGDVIDECGGVRTAASEAEQRQRLPQYSLGEDDQHLPAVQSCQRTGLLQGASTVFVLSERYCELMLKPTMRANEQQFFCYLYLAPCTRL